MPVTNCSKCHDGQTQCRKSEVVISRNKRASRAQGMWADHRESLTSSEKHFSHLRPIYTGNRRNLEKRDLGHPAQVDRCACRDQMSGYLSPPGTCQAAPTVWR